MALAPGQGGVGNSEALARRWSISWSARRFTHLASAGARYSVEFVRVGMSPAEARQRGSCVRHRREGRHDQVRSCAEWAVCDAGLGSRSRTKRKGITDHANPEGNGPRHSKTVLHPANKNGSDSTFCRACLQMDCVDSIVGSVLGELDTLIQCCNVSIRCTLLLR